MAESMSNEEPRRRVIRTAKTLEKPRSINWVAEAANVNWGTAKKYILELEQRGYVQETEDGYITDELKLYLDSVHELATENTEDELLDMVDSQQDDIDTLKEEYSVDSLTDLQQMKQEAKSPERVRELRRAASVWKRAKDRIGLYLDAVGYADNNEKNGEHDKHHKTVA